MPWGVVEPSPERVVTSITRLVLSPYSAGGAPAMTSIDCTASSGIWLEKVLLCWSVMGWPSSENEFSACSPMPWNMPFESEATPGVASVTNELSSDDELSSGIFSKSWRSTSVWNVESVSTRSPASLCTVTVSVAAPISIVIFKETGSDPCTSTSCA